ncbi:U3 small nucleolar RNA associated protein 14 [Trichuris trichiura]|uniref:U3 small nucleolar RNA associated protein 14 n=1 Tax=Trichuris trichiura TaxID=36087 RepID=A0A077ZBH3_TRITR|nr:U3 small nucleolar RNA associated protein 14 [Trichuris trichiura]
MEKRAKLKKEIRGNAAVGISEFRLCRSSKAQAKLEDLVKSAKRAKKIGALKDQLSVARKRNAILSSPLHRQAASRIRRSVGYREKCEELKDWDDFVHLSRVADRIHFPLQEGARDLKIVEGAVDVPKPVNEFEAEVAEALRETKSNLDNECIVTEEEKELLQAMKLEEAKAVLNRLRHFRALASYQDAKNKRQSKIKSKRYHRILKQQQRRRLWKEFQDLVQRNPREATEKLELLEKDRIIERSTLRHRGTGRWSKKMMMYAKRDYKVREAIQEQIRFSKELIAKLGYAHELVEEPRQDGDEFEALADDGHPLQEMPSSTNARLDVNAAIFPPVLEDRVDLGDQEMLLEEAFMEDDVVADFEAETQSVEEQPVELTLPGWNSWVGPGAIVRPEVKDETSSKNVAKTGVSPKKPEKKLVHFSSKANESLKAKQLGAVPFPFASQDAFERSASNPIGKEWNPAMAHSLLIEPSVSTEMGEIIRPADRSLLPKGGKQQYSKDFTKTRRDRKTKLRPLERRKK